MFLGSSCAHTISAVGNRSSSRHMRSYGKGEIWKGGGEGMSKGSASLDLFYRRCVKQICSIDVVPNRSVLSTLCQTDLFYRRCVKQTCSIDVVSNRSVLSTLCQTDLFYRRCVKQTCSTLVMATSPSNPLSALCFASS